MNAPYAIFRWIEENVKPMRRSRQKTLADIVSAALRLNGTGVLALGRGLPGHTAPKHAIKRVWRFFRNPRLEVDAVQLSLAHLLAPKQVPVVILLDWTEYGDYKTLSAALPRDGRSLAIWWKTIGKDSGEGTMVDVEKQALWALRDLFPFRTDLILIADRGFGNTRWIGDIQKWGWGFVQRVSQSVYVENETYCRALKDLPVPRQSGSLDWGEMTLTRENGLCVRLVTTWDKKAKEPWYLVTNLTNIPQKITRLYLRRMWIEEEYRDLKNRKWGLGFDESYLSAPEREDRRWCVLAIAHLFLMAYGAAAEQADLAKRFLPNTPREREISLARLGAFVIETALQPISCAIDALNQVPP